MPDVQRGNDTERAYIYRHQRPPKFNDPCKGGHTFRLGGSHVTIESGVKWTLPGLRVQYIPDYLATCTENQFAAFQNELEEDVDTGLLDDVVKVIRVFLSFMDLFGR